MKRNNHNTPGPLHPEIRAFIDGYRKEIYTTYELPAEARLRVDALLASMEQQGRKCDSRREFEDVFYNRTMSQELYRMLSDLFCYYRPAAKPNDEHKHQ